MRPDGAARLSPFSAAGRASAGARSTSRLQRQAHAETRGSGRARARDPSCAPRSSGPRESRASPRHEALQEACSQDVITLVLHASIAGRRPCRISAPRRSPRPSETARPARRDSRPAAISSVVQRRAVREHAAVALGQRVDALTGQRGVVERSGAGFSRPASTRVSASAMRPSASVWMTSIMVPSAAVTTSRDLYACGPMRFSVMASQQSTAERQLQARDGEQDARARPRCRTCPGACRAWRGTA